MTQNLNFWLAGLFFGAAFSAGAFGPMPDVRQQFGRMGQAGNARGGFYAAPQGQIPSARATTCRRRYATRAKSGVS